MIVGGAHVHGFVTVERCHLTRDSIAVFCMSPRSDRCAQEGCPDDDCCDEAQNEPDPLHLTLGGAIRDQGNRQI